MKHLSVVTIISLLILSCHSEKSGFKSDLEAANLRGKIKKIQRTINLVGDDVKCPACTRDNNKNAYFMYDEKGNLTESVNVDDNGDTVLISKYIYDSHSVCNEIQKYSGGKLVGRDLNKITDGKIEETKEINEDGTPGNIYDYIYTGTMISSEQTRNKNGEIISSTSYELQNDQVETQTDKNAKGEITCVTKFRRNSNNDIIESIKSYALDATVYKPSFEYEYDSKGNWIKQTQYFDGKIAGIIIRNITYLD